jgi:mRNA interferase HicA
MKRRDLIRLLEQAGCVLMRRGGKHDWYHNPANKISQPVPRHTEINDPLAKHILKTLKIKA